MNFEINQLSIAVMSIPLDSNVTIVRCVAMQNSSTDNHNICCDDGLYRTQESLWTVMLADDIVFCS